MAVKVAAKVFALNQFGQLAGRGCFYFAAVLAQLRWHPCKPQRAVNLFFRPARDDHIIAEEAVLVEQESTRLCDAAQMHVVGLGSGEIGERRAETLCRHYAQVHLQTAFEYDAGLGLARADYLSDTGEGVEMLHDRGGVGSGGYSVEIADGLTPAPKAAGQLELADCRAFSQLGFDLRGGPRRLRIQHSLFLAGLAPQQ